MSQGAFLLVVAWGVDRWKNGPIFRNRGWAFWQKQPVLWAVMALFAWELFSQLWTENWAYGWRALRIQLPLLAFPLILTTGRWDHRRGLNTVQWALAIAVIAAYQLPVVGHAERRRAAASRLVPLHLAHSLQPAHHLRLGMVAATLVQNETKGSRSFWLHCSAFLAGGLPGKLRH